MSTRRFLHSESSATTRLHCMLWALCTLCLLAAYHWTTQPRDPRFLGFSGLEWESLGGFLEGNAPVSLNLERGVYSDPLFPAALRATATSRPFVPLGPTLELAFTGGALRAPNDPVVIKVIDREGRLLARVTPWKSSPPPKPSEWSTLRITLPSQHPADLPIQLQLFRNPVLTDAAPLSFRDRVNFFERPSFLRHTAPLPAPDLVKALAPLGIAIGLAVTAVALLPAILRKEWHAFWLFLLLFELSFAVHYRHSSFLFWDEFYLFERFMKRGFGGVVYSHNEHFLPLFFSWLYGEARAFKDCYFFYLLTSSALHGLNATLLVRLLQRLTPRSVHAREGALLAGLLFVVNSVHGENLQWAFEQCVLLVNTALLVSLHFGISYLRTRRRLPLVGIAVSAMCAPLLFGNGFSLLLQLAAVLLPLAVLAIKELPSSTAGDRDSPVLPAVRSLLPALAVLGLSLAVPAWLYWLHPKGVGTGYDEARPLDNLTAVVSYLFVGSEAGGVLRGLGFFPFLDIKDPERLVHSAKMSPYLILGICGAILSALLLVTNRVIARTPAAKEEGSGLWLAGQLLIFASLVLPSLGRWQFGDAQALSLRYHYATLIGLAIMGYPLLCRTAERLTGSGKRTVPSIFVGAYLAVHLYAIHQFLFTPYGPTHRTYAAELKNWNILLKQTANEATTYEADNTPFAGLHPLHRKTITSERHPDEVYRNLNWLDPEKYPWLDKNRFPIREDEDDH